MICKNCGKTLDDKARFCSDCGTEVDPMEVIESIQAKLLENESTAMPEDEPEAVPEEEQLPDDTANLLSELNESINASSDDAVSAEEEEPSYEPQPEILPEPDTEPESNTLPEPVPEKEKAEPDDTPDHIMPASVHAVSEDAPELPPAPEPLPRTEEPPTAPEPAQESPLPIPEEPEKPEEPYPTAGYPYTPPEPVPYAGAPSPEYQQPYTDEMPVGEEAAEEEQEEKPIKVGFLRLSGAFIVSVLAGVFLIAVSLLFCVKLGVSGDILRRRIEKISMSTILDGSFDNRTVSDNIYNNLHFHEATAGQADTHTFREFLENIDLSDFLADKAADYSDFIIAGRGKDPSVTVDEIVTFLQENSDASAETFGYTMITADYNTIRRQLNESGAAEKLSISYWSEQAGFRISAIHYLFSFLTIAIFLTLVVVLLIWIAVIVDKRGKHLMNFYGNIFCFSGGLMLLIGIAASAGTAVAHVITGNVICFAASSVLLPFALFSVCTGAFELILGIIFRKIRKAICNKDKRLKAVEKALQANTL